MKFLLESFQMPTWRLAIVALAFVSAIALAPQAAIAADAASAATPESITSDTAAAAADAAAAAGAPTVTVEQVTNPYGIQALWSGGDFIARGVLILMLIMSAATWYIMIAKLYDQRKVMLQAKSANATFWKSRSVAAGLETLKQGSPFWYIAERGMSANEHHEGTMVEQVDLSTWVTMTVGRAVDEIQSELQKGLAVLATVGSTAPFVGLFGTVWGIYHALTAIGISGQASIDKVAGPVGEALIMTAMGLAVAVPAVMGYNWLVRRNKAAMDKVRAFGGDLHSVLISGARVGEAANRRSA